MRKFAATSRVRIIGAHDGYSAPMLAHFDQCDRWIIRSFGAKELEYERLAPFFMAHRFYSATFRHDRLVIVLENGKTESSGG
jgi:hypothetical protein